MQEMAGKAKGESESSQKARRDGAWTTRGGTDLWGKVGCFVCFSNREEGGDGYYENRFADLVVSMSRPAW